MNIVEGVVGNVNQYNTKQRWKQFYVIADYKNHDGSVNRSTLHIMSAVAVPFLVPVTVNLPYTAPPFTATTTTTIPSNPSISVPSNIFTPVDAAPILTTTTTTVSLALIPTTTTESYNSPTTVAPAPDPTITTTFPDNPPTIFFPEPGTTTTTCFYANPCIQNYPVSDPNPPPTHVAPVPDTHLPTTSTPTVVADWHGVKW